MPQEEYFVVQEIDNMGLPTELYSVVVTVDGDELVVESGLHLGAAELLQETCTQRAITTSSHTA